MNKKTHQMLKALLMSKDLHTGLICYDLLCGKTKPNDCVRQLITPIAGSPYERPLDSETQKEAYRIFMGYVFEGEINKAYETANEEDKAALDNLTAIQMLQGLLSCEQRKTARIAYEILAGIEKIEDVQKRNDGLFFGYVCSGNVREARNHANAEQLAALYENFKPEYKFRLASTENYHRLNYIMLDQKMNIDDVLNIMIKSYYEILRADEHAQLMGEDLPQIAYI